MNKKKIVSSILMTLIYNGSALSHEETSSSIKKIIRESQEIQGYGWAEADSKEVEAEVIYALDTLRGLTKEKAWSYEGDYKIWSNLQKLDEEVKRTPFGKIRKNLAQNVTAELMKMNLVVMKKDDNNTSLFLGLDDDLLTRLDEQGILTRDIVAAGTICF